MGIVAILAGLIDAYQSLKGPIGDLISTAKETGELTAEQHAELVAHMNGEGERPEWLPSSE